MRGVAQQDCHFGFRAFEYVIVKVGLNLKLTLRLFRIQGCALPLSVYLAFYADRNYWKIMSMKAIWDQPPGRCARS